MKTPIESGDFFVEIEGYGTYHYSPMTDAIQVFPDAEFNHLHYWDADNHEMRFQFLGQAALDFLHEHGLPHTVRDSITPFEHNSYIQWVVDNEEAELAELTPEAFDE